MVYGKEDLDKAFNKELFVIKNDLYYQQVELTQQDETELLRIDISYIPHSILSGDSYSLRKTSDGRLFGFIADAMGKGVSAAMSAMAVTRFLNYFFDEMEEEKGFVFEELTHKILKYLQKNLFDEEIMSLVLIEFDLLHASIQYASCGMPAFFIIDEKGHCQSLRSNNPPLSIFTEKISIDTFSSGSITKMLCYSDGLSESMMLNEQLYGTTVKNDFIDSLCVKDFKDKVAQRIGKSDDDLTYIYIQKVNPLKGYTQRLIPSRYDALEETLEHIAGYLKLHSVDSKISSQIILACSELLLNALEHGSFGVDKGHKQFLIEQNVFEDEMIRLEQLHHHKKIKIAYHIIPSGNRELFEATITDEGEGFDTTVLKNIVINGDKFNGRGFIIVRKLLDHFYFSTKGNAITIQKFITPLLEL